jgi:hypothetical protein
MNYFVCIECNSYHLWQTELLIQSFKRFGLQDNLYIAICKTEEPVNLQFTQNFNRHKNRFFFENQHGVKNKFYTLSHLLNEGIIKAPFATIHPDMILVKPILAPETDLVLSRFDEKQDFKNEIKPYINEFITHDRFATLHPSAIYVANNTLDKSFFLRLWQLAARFDFRDKWGEKAVWYLGIQDYLNNVNECLTVGSDFYEQSMLTYNPTQNFIHYNHGLPPGFHKIHFQFKPPCLFCIDGMNPLKIMHSINPNNTTDYIVKLIESYWKECGFNFTNNVWEPE